MSMLSYAGSWILASRSLAWVAVIVLLDTTISTADESSLCAMRQP